MSVLNLVVYLTIGAMLVFLWSHYFHWSVPDDGGHTEKENVCLHT
jgi:hypothetical protein